MTTLVESTTISPGSKFLPGLLVVILDIVESDATVTVAVPSIPSLGAEGIKLKV